MNLAHIVGVVGQASSHTAKRFFKKEITEEEKKIETVFVFDAADADII